MSDVDLGGTAADEAAIESRYNVGLSRVARDIGARVREQTANTWTSTTKVDLPRRGELVGRVALGDPSALLGGDRDFYIGTAYHDGGDFQVFSWTAEIACTFYRKSTAHHELCDDVIGVRVFEHRAGRIVGYEDEGVTDTPTAALFPKRKLEVPRAPTGRLSPPVAPNGGADAPHAADHEKFSPSPDATPTATSPRAAGSPMPRSDSSETIIPGPAIRTPDLLRRRLAAPKTSAMSAVLSTLQPDQYDAITRTVSESQILQGHPGTGKTIIAAHRAAYLLSAELPSAARPQGRILVLGPTEEYVAHVRGAMSKLIEDDARYEVRAIPSLLEELAQLPQSAVPTQSYVWEDVSTELADLVDFAYKRARAALDGAGEKPTASDVYAELLWLLQDPPADGLEADWVAYLRELPPRWEELRRLRISSYRGLMAYIGVRTAKVPNPGHVIVDEAQDVHPIEWEVLGRLGNRGGWTILGDLNQRRTDHTFGSWGDVAQLLAIEDDEGEPPIRLLERGYRSTAQIMRFANQLLPPRERSLYSLQQDGDPPTVIRALSVNEVPDRTLRAVDELTTRVGTGTVAVVTVAPGSVQGAMVRRGWKADFGDPSTWRIEDRVVELLVPERSRGLEFDGVVVVEPADFPENVGRQGVLYTALTRANRLLVVVHQKPLPRGMKASV